MDINLFASIVEQFVFPQIELFDVFYEIQTPVLSPDGENIKLYAKKCDPAHAFITDRGETNALVHNERFVELTGRLYNIAFVDGALYYKYNNDAKEFSRGLHNMCDLINFIFAHWENENAKNKN